MTTRVYKWLVVDLRTNSGVETATVSECWLTNQKFLKYPSLVGSKFEKALRSHAEPEDFWDDFQYTLRKVCSKYLPPVLATMNYVTKAFVSLKKNMMSILFFVDLSAHMRHYVMLIDSYLGSREEARALEDRAMRHPESELNTDNEDKDKRAKKPRRPYSPSVESRRCYEKSVESDEEEKFEGYDDLKPIYSTDSDSSQPSSPVMTLDDVLKEINKPSAVTPKAIASRNSADKTLSPPLSSSPLAKNKDATGKSRVFRSQSFSSGGDQGAPSNQDSSPSSPVLGGKAIISKSHIARSKTFSSSNRNRKKDAASGQTVRALSPPRSFQVNIKDVPANPSTSSPAMKRRQPAAAEKESAREEPQVSEGNFLIVYMIFFRPYICQTPFKWFLYLFHRFHGG